ncbi:MAG: SPOR domain-containing protein [Chitinivibrionales bacterium]
MDRHFYYALIKISFYRVAVLACCIAGRAHSSGDCLAMVEKSEFDSARACLQKAILKKPSDPNIQITLAKLTSNAAAARASYKKLAALTSNPDSVRADAYYHLACMSYMMANYAKAESYCGAACNLDKRASYVDLYALCAMRNKRDSLAQALLQGVLSGDSSSGTTRLYLGSLLYERKEYAQALAVFDEVVNQPDSAQWSSAALALKFACYAHAGEKQKAINMEALLEEKKGLLETSLVDEAKKLMAQTGLLSSKDTADGSSDTAQKVVEDKNAYYLQVGAFGALENAQALSAELKRFCANVATVAAISNNKNIYRVRIGSFGSKESAQAFGDSVLAKKNIAFRILMEQ